MVVTVVGFCLQTTDNHRNKLGWVREMYAYSLAAAITKVPHIVEPRYQSVLIAQPPADDYLVRFIKMRAIL